MADRVSLQGGEKNSARTCVAWNFARFFNVAWLLSSSTWLDKVLATFVDTFYRTHYVRVIGYILKFH